MNIPKANYYREITSPVAIQAVVLYLIVMIWGCSSQKDFDPQSMRGYWAPDVESAAEEVAKQAGHGDTEGVLPLLRAALSNVAMKITEDEITIANMISPGTSLETNAYRVIDSDASSRTVTIEMVKGDNKIKMTVSVEGVEGDRLIMGSQLYNRINKEEYERRRDKSGL